jgi:hypothetical protein
MDDKHIIKKSSLQDLAAQLVPKVETEEEPGGDEHPICIVGVSSIGEIYLMTILNKDDAVWYYVEECDEYLEHDFQEDPGIYLIDFWIQGEKDYWGEYDAWSMYDYIIKYKYNIADKRKDKFDKKDFWKENFENKVYEDPGSEYPRVVLMIRDDGEVFILDILNEEKAYKIVIKEAVHILREIESLESIESEEDVKCGCLYEADISIGGDMDHIFDVDADDKVRLFNIKKIKLELEDKPIWTKKMKEEKEQKELEDFVAHVDKLRMEDENEQCS